MKSFKRKIRDRIIDKDISRACKLFLGTVKNTLRNEVSQYTDGRVAIHTAPKEICVAGAMLMTIDYGVKQPEFTDGFYFGYRVGIDRKMNIAMEAVNDHLKFVCLCTSDQHVKYMKPWVKRVSLARKFSRSILRTFRKTQVNKRLELLQNFDSQVAN